MSKAKVGQDEAQRAKDEAAVEAAWDGRMREMDVLESELGEVFPRNRYKGLPPEMQGPMHL